MNDALRGRDDAHGRLCNSGDNRIVDTRSNRVDDRPFKHYYPLLPARSASLRAATKATVLSPMETQSSRHRHPPHSIPTTRQLSGFLSTLVRDATRIAALLFRTRAGLSSSRLALASSVFYRALFSAPILAPASAFAIADPLFLSCAGLCERDSLLARDITLDLPSHSGRRYTFSVRGCFCSTTLRK